MSSSIPTRVSRELHETARLASEVTSRSVTQQIEHWARIGREVELASSTSQREVAAVLAGLGSYDDLGVEEQSLVRALLGRAHRTAAGVGRPGGGVRRAGRDACRDGRRRTHRAPWPRRTGPRGDRPRRGLRRGAGGRLRWATRSFICSPGPTAPARRPSTTGCSPRPRACRSSTQITWRRVTGRATRRHTATTRRSSLRTSVGSCSTNADRSAPRRSSRTSPRSSWSSTRSRSATWWRCTW